MAKKFDLASLMAEGKVPNLDTAGRREQIEYIHIDQIDDDPNNFYELSGLKELAENIELIGLQQPLRVRANPEDTSRVILVSGHRRRAAIRLLVEEGREDLAEIPCIREAEADSSALQELRLIYANSDTRKMSSADLSRQAERVEILLYQLKEEGYEFPGRMRDHVAEACKVSKSKLARLKVIREGLAPDFVEAFQKSTLPEQTAYALARLPKDFQQRIFRVSSVKALNGSYVARVGQMYAAGKRWEPALTCPDGSECKHGDAALRHDLESYDSCGGNKCCLTCYKAIRSWGACERMCSKAKAVRETKAAEEKANEEKQSQKTIRGYQKETQQNAQRLLRAVDAAGLKDSDKVSWDYSGDTPVSQIRKYAAGDFEDTGDWYEARFLPRRLHDPVKTAKQLKCTTDFLFGLTEDPQPVGKAETSGWMPGDVKPERPMDAVARFDLGSGKKHKIFARWTGYTWVFAGNGTTVEQPVVDWFPLPMVEQPVADWFPLPEEESST